MTDDYPTLTHPSLEHGIRIRDELSFRAAKVFWDDIAAKYSNTSLDQQTVRVIPDKREENLARSTIPSDELREDTEVELSCGSFEAPPPIKKPEKKVKANVLKNLHNRWTDEEMFVIQDAPGWRDAVTAYLKAFPDKRNKNSVAQQWKKIKQGIVKKRVAVPVGEPETPEPFRELPDITSHCEGDFNRGQKVKMGGSIGSPYHHQTGIIERTPPGQEVMVRFEKGTVWVSKKDLVMT